MNEHWLTNVYVQPPFHSLDFDHEQRSNSTLRLVNELWLTNVNAQPAPHILDSDLKQRNKLNPFTGFGDVPQLIQQVASSCAQHSSMSLIKDETTH